MNELKRPGVVGGEIRTMTNAQHGRTLQLTVEQAHDAALAAAVRRLVADCRIMTLSRTVPGWNMPINNAALTTLPTP